MAVTNISTPAFKLDKGGLKAGVYIFKISSGKGIIATGKLIVLDK